MSLEKLLKRAREYETNIALPHIKKPLLDTERFGQKPAWPLPASSQPPIRARSTRKNKGIEGYD